MSAPARDFLVRAIQGFYQPRSGLPPWRWHEEQGTQLSTEESQDYAGPYDSSLAPQNRFLMEFAQGRFSENVEFLPETPADTVWRECVVMKSSQVGVTLAVLLVMVWWIAELRKNIIYAIDSATEAKRISKARLQPLIKSCAPAAEHIGEDDDGLNTLTLYLLGLIVYIIGGGSEGSFQNKTASLAVLDEADYHPEPRPGLPNNADEIRSRLKAVADAKIYIISKPKTEAHLTFREFRTGTQHKCFLPCPHCDHLQELTWEHVRFDHCKDLSGEYDLERVKRETHYECEFCHKAIAEAAKRAMLQGHRWRQTNPRPQPGKISAHISDLYSLFENCTWGILACEFIEALKSVPKLIAFRTGRLGLPSKLQTSERTPSDIYKLRHQYRRGTLHAMPALVAMGADVQGDVRKWVKGAFTAAGELYVFDWGITLAFDDLIDFADDPVPVGMPMDWPKKKPWDGPTVRVDQGIIDEGHIPTEVRRFCLRSDGLWVPSKGRGGVQVRRTVNESEAECDGEILTVYHFDDDDFKKQLYINRIGQLEKILAGKSKTPRMFMPWDLEAEFVDELTSEKLTVETDRFGFSREKWKKDANIPNDFGDALKQLLVIWYVMGPELQAQAAAEAAESTEGKEAA